MIETIEKSNYEICFKMPDGRILEIEEYISWLQEELKLLRKIEIPV